jgi:glutamine synthetase
MQEILEKIKEKEVKFIDLAFTDIFGNLKSNEIPSDDLESTINKGIWFDGSSIKGYARIKESDMYLKPDISTFAIIPGRKKTRTARFFCDVYTPDGELFLGDPRAVLKKTLNEARKQGYLFKTGPEVEFYLFKKNEEGFSIPDNDTGSYFDSPVGDMGSEIRKEVMLSLENYGINSERGHHEVGGGQHEIGFKYDDALITADRVITLKREIKTIAHKYHLTASFMPKPRFNKAGNGMHIHFSLFDLKNNPIFYSENENYNLSGIAKRFIAGNLHYIKETTAIFNPTVNSYKRLVAGYEAPVYICWGSRNRSALIRVPEYTKGREASVRAEIRSPDPSCSPYLAFAAILKAGLEGINENISLVEESKDNAFKNNEGLDVLPRTLEKAIEYMENSKLVRELLGKELFNKYIEAKKNEIYDYNTSVTDWEKNRYLENC